MNELGRIRRIMTALEDFDLFDEILWNVKVGRIAFFIRCNDLCHLATADAEEIDVSDLPDLKRAMTDCIEAGDEVFAAYGASLWVCRKRGMRPTARELGSMPDELMPLFEAAELAAAKGV